VRVVSVGDAGCEHEVMMMVGMLGVKTSGVMRVVVLMLNDDVSL
jgi:hypothetical protein